MLNGLGHRVYAAVSAEQALAVIRRERWLDLVLINHDMPEMAGTELIEAIRAECPALPIIFSTPLADVALQQVSKPIRKSELSRAIARVAAANSARSAR